MNLYSALEKSLLQTALEDSVLHDEVALWLDLHESGWSKILKHGDLLRWKTGFDALPNVKPSSYDLGADIVRVGEAADSPNTMQATEGALQAMRPWRKGPFDIFGVHVDTEWHSDWKWKRVQKHLSPLKGRAVLDVGCGSGYHMWRMLAMEAGLVLGIDPTALFSMHFATVKRYMPEAQAFLVPVGIDDIPQQSQCFDTVFSMGILYHRRSPLDHLLQLKGQLRAGGELVLETLVIDGDEGRCLVPEGRYAKMRNVWFIPSVKMLELWLRRCGFKNIRCVDVDVTSIDEQRSTDWMQFESLPDFLDEHDPAKTVEGYSSPMRAVIIAETV
ncbi:MAG: tRNA 5-methoxyuridine(34)/uridine 5-oxyacetic acid(34) synthase CmoB [Mariprofundaceae bacterium]